LIGGGGGDIINGGADFDTVDYSVSGSAVSLALGANGAQTIGQGGHAQGDRVRNVEHIFGSNFNDTLTGNNLQNAINGQGGNDTVNGGSGSDLLAGGDGRDTLNGGNGSDAIDGGSGNDTINGGGGNDFLFGGASNDAFVFAGGFDHDRITDFVAGAGTVDVIRFNQNLFQNFNAVINASEQVGDDVVITLNAGNSLTLDDVQLATLHQDDFQFV
jgi:Ca2+-binding RTX toxin-like protein